jgi:hypothetical protein
LDDEDESSSDSDSSGAMPGTLRRSRSGSVAPSSKANQTKQRGRGCRSIDEFIVEDDDREVAAGAGERRSRDGGSGHDNEEAKRIALEQKQQVRHRHARTPPFHNPDSTGALCVTI